MSLLNSIIPSRHRASASCEAPSASVGATRKPSYRVNESDEAYRLTVNLPGVTKDGLEITADADELRIVGTRAWKQPEGWTTLHRETAAANYELVLTHENSLNTDKITAELRDGVLNVTLPKAEEIKPRKIAVS